MRSRLIFFVLAITAIGLGNLLEAPGQPQTPLPPAAGNGSVTLEVLNPRAEIPPVQPVAPAPRGKSLSSKKIALIDNGKAGAGFFLSAVEEQLKKKLPGATILRFNKPGRTTTATPKFYPEVAKKCDAFIYATGD